VADTDLGNMHFDRLDDGTDEDFEVMRRVHGRNLAKLPDLLLSMLRNLKGDAAYPVDRLEHSVQTATRAMRAGADEEMIVCALLHTCARRWDRSTTARWARPFVSERNHGSWPTTPSSRPTSTRAASDSIPTRATSTRTAPSPYYQACVDFTTNWDEVSFDATYDSEPLSTFEPMVRSVLSRPWAPPGTN
jgi:predicted HD phosphohydrolase